MTEKPLDLDEIEQAIALWSEASLYGPAVAWLRALIARVRALETELEMSLSHRQADACRDFDRIKALESALNKLRDESEVLQKHRDAWRGYCYGKREKPNDFTDGNLVDRPQTKIEKLEADLAEARQETFAIGKIENERAIELMRLRETLKDVAASGVELDDERLDCGKYEVREYIDPFLGGFTRCDACGHEVECEEDEEW